MKIKEGIQLANAILLEVMNNALRSVAEQMSATMVRSKLFNNCKGNDGLLLCNI